MNYAHSKALAVPALFFIAGVAFMRPMILGYYSATFGLLFLACAILTTLIFVARNGRIDRRFLNLFLVAICVGFISIIFLIPVVGAKIAFTSLILMLTANVACFLTISVFSLQTFNYVRLSLRFVVFSNFVTLILAGFNVDSLGTLSYVTLPISGHGIIEEFSLLFPMSTIPYRMTNELFVFPRATFLSIEPGTGVLIVFLWRFLEKAHSEKHAVAFNIIFVLALLSTASTTAPLMIGAFFAVPRFFEGRPIVRFKTDGIKINIKKLVISTTLLIGSIYLLFYAPYFGIIDKSATHGASFEDRIATFSGAKGSAVHRYVTVFLLIAVYYVVKLFVIKRNFIGPYSALFIVSMLNVGAFSIIFWLTIYLVLVIKMRDEARDQVQDNSP